MAGMLTVVNPRRRRRAKRRTHAKRTVKRRRRRAVRHAFANPRRRRRAVARRRSTRRRVHNRRRRHHNPRIGGGMVGTLIKGMVAGGGVIATNVATNGVNHFLGANALQGPAKLALKAAVGLVALPMVLGFVPGGRKYANSVRLGAGIAIALDIFEQYIKTSLPTYLQDYQYGALSGYGYGTLSDWAPQAGMSGDGVYEGGTYS